MRKSHRDKIKCYKKGGQIVSENANESDLGRAKKVNTPAEDMYLGKANAKRFIADNHDDDKDHEDEYEYRQKSKSKNHIRERRSQQRIVISIDTEQR